MDNTSGIKTAENRLKTLLEIAGKITPFELGEILLCFLLARASLFEVIKPFGLSVYCAARFSRPAGIMAAGSLFLGNLAFSGPYEAVRQLCAILIFELVLHFRKISGNGKSSPVTRPAVLGVSVLATGLVRSAMQGFRLYDIVASLICSAFAFSTAILVHPALAVQSEPLQRRFAESGGLTVAKAILSCLAVISLKDVYIAGMDLSSMAAGLLVLAFARSMGSACGACIGACVGFVMAMYRIPDSLELPGMYALAGAAAGIRLKRKIFPVCLWTLTILFFTGLSILNGNMVTGYYSLLVSGVLFLFISPRAMAGITEYLSGPAACRALEADAGKRASLEASDRLYILGKALSRVSRCLREFLDDESEEERTMAEAVMETVADRVCRRCPMCDKCWGTNFIKTYKLVEKALSSLETDESGLLEVPGWFRSACTRNEKFVENLGIAFSLYKSEKMWRTRLKEARERLAEQVGIISGNIMSMARSIIDSRSRYYETEESFLEAAAALGLPVEDIRIGKGAGQTIAADLVCEGIHRIDMDVLDNTVKAFLGGQMVRIGEMRRDMLGHSILRYMNKPRYRTITGVARLSRENSDVSGDSFTFFVSSSGFHISAVSDGAGSGARAERYSRNAVQMLEYLLDEGVTMDFAVRLIRMYLGIRGDKEPLATLDACAVSLVDGSLRFYKMGAPPSYIRNMSGVTEISGDDAGGASCCDDCAVSGHRVTEGDFVILVSDGVYHAFCSGGQSALQKYIASIDTLNPQQMADMILTESTVRGNGARDDMTVLVTRLW